MVVLTGFEPALSDFLTSPLFSDYKVTPQWKRRTRVSDTRGHWSPSDPESGTMPQSPTWLTPTLQDYDAPRKGLEPLTLRLTAECSTILSYLGICWCALSDSNRWCATTSAPKADAVTTWLKAHWWSGRDLNPCLRVESPLWLTATLPDHAMIRWYSGCLSTPRGSTSFKANRHVSFRI